MIDWSDIAVFLAVAEEGSLSKAAKRMAVSQPTVGRRLSALEERLGSTLFVRTAQGLRLTDAGRVILENAQRMNDEAAAIARAAEGRNSGLAGPVTVSIVEGLSNMWLTPQLSEFQKRYPDILVRLRVEATAANLVQREADIAVRLFEPMQQSLIAKKVATIAFGIYASKAYLDAHGRPQRLEDIVEHAMVCSDGDVDPNAAAGFRQFLPAWGRFVFVSNSITATMTATRSGLGIGVHAINWSGIYPDLERLFPAFTAGEVDIWLVTHEELRTSARIRAMFDFLAERLSESAASFAGKAPPSWPITHLARGLAADG